MTAKKTAASQPEPQPEPEAQPEAEAPEDEAVAEETQQPEATTASNLGHVTYRHKGTGTTTTLASPHHTYENSGAWERINPETGEPE